MFLEIILFFLSTFITFILTIRQVPVAFLQQITVIMLIALVFLSKKIFSSGQTVLTKALRLAGIFLSSFLIQLFVFSTGGFHSPFLILFHFYTLAASFLLSLEAGLAFVTLSVVSLLLASYSNIGSLNIFKDDPGTGIIYMVSFVVIVPLAQLLIRNYQLKDTISKALARYLQLSESKGESILQNVNELVIVTDKELKIISVNTAFEKMFKIHTIDVRGKDLLEAVPLINSQGETLVKEALSLDKVFLNKTTILLGDFYLKFPSKKKKVIIQISPILDKEEEVDQIIFVISETRLSGEIEKHVSLDEALKRHSEVGEVLKKSLLDIKHPELATYAQLFAKQEEDLITLIEIEDHPMKEVDAILDIALICQKKILEKGELAKALNVSLKVDLPKEEVSERIIFDIAKEKEATSSDWSFSHFAVPIDEKWFSIVIQKLLDLAILLSSSYPKAGVVLSLLRDEIGVEVKIKANFPKISDQKLEELFIKYYGSLGQSTNLKLGSGLEGFIAKVISDELNIVLGVESSDDPPQLIFTLKLAKNTE